MTAIRRWLVRWGPLLPILVAELIILLGFGALLPVLPLFVVEHGIDVPTLGLIAAAWSVAKLIAEPIFGYLADRTSRKPFLIGGAIVLAVATMLPVWYTSALELFVLRLIAGAAAGAYDPAARGLIVDNTPEGERGEAFGIYAAFQMGGFVLGPVIGAFGAALGGGFSFPFLFTGVLTLGAAGLLAVTLPGGVRRRRSHHGHHSSGTIPAIPEPLPVEAIAAAPATAIQVTEPHGWSPTSLLNHALLGAVVIHFGFSLAFGTYEVVWSLFLADLGASIEWVGLSFALFGLPMMIVSPIAGRQVDRRGAVPFIAVGGVVICFSGIAYALATEPVFPTLVVPVEAVAEALLMPGLYALVAFGSPSGRSSTAQGIFGAVGTIGLIVATIASGALWEFGRAWPFAFFVLGAGTCLVLGLVIHRAGRRRVPDVVLAT
jgi:DHA1 family multidrug resistance protein-like MFS transporter